jgi:hypothetical protein
MAGHGFTEFAQAQQLRYGVGNASTAPGDEHRSKEYQEPVTHSHDVTPIQTLMRYNPQTKAGPWAMNSIIIAIDLLPTFSSENFSNRGRFRSIARRDQ